MLNKVVAEAAQPLLDKISPLVSSNTFFVPEAQLSDTRLRATPASVFELGYSEFRV